MTHYSIGSLIITQALTQVSAQSLTQVLEWQWYWHETGKNGIILAGMKQNNNLRNF